MTIIRPKKVALVYPAKSGSQKFYEGILPPLGLAQIATCIRQLKPAPEVKLFDLTIMSNASFRREVGGFMPDIVGINMLTPTAQKSLEIALRIGDQQIVAKP